MAALKIENLITDHLDLWTAAVRPKSSAGRGSNSKLELTGIKKLRELILELAVRGKLVPQDPSDEPASVLLERITAEKAQLVKEGKIKKPKALPEIGEEDKPFELPEGWKWDKVGNLATIVRGVSYPKHQVSENNKIDHITLLRANNINGSLNFDSTIYVPRMLVKEEQVILAGDIVIAMSSGSPDLVGKAAQSNVDLDATFGTFCGVVRVIDSVLKDFFGFLFTTPLYRKQTQLAGKGIGIKNLNKDNLDNLDIPIPPLKEQRRIVAKVDELMALCDQLEQCSESQLAAHQTLVETLLGSLLQPAAAAEGSLTDSCDADELAQNWARLSTHFDTLFTTEASIDALKQTILQLAVMGKLVPQDPSDEPAAALLARIAAEKAQLVKEKKIKKEKPLPAISEEEKPFKLPQGWEWCRLPDLGELARGKSKHRPRNDPKLYVNGTIPLVQTGDVARADGVIESYTAMYNEIGLAQSQLWPKGTLCITIAANIADTGILGFDACFPDSIVGYTPYESSLPVVYFDLFIRTAKENLERFAPSTAQKNINLEILSNILVPCPPTQEFIRIVSRVNDLFAICDQLKARLQTSQQTQLALAESLVEGALA